MAYDESKSHYGMDQYCPVHGDETMRECRMCGREYCKTCYPGFKICPTCTEEAEENSDDDDDEEDEDDELAGLGDLLGDDLDDEDEDEDFSADLDDDSDEDKDPEDD